jgi:hypothetical protein
MLSIQAGQIFQALNTGDIDMPEVSFTYNIPEKSIGGFVIDAFLAEHYSFSNDVTTIPVEEGSIISDHIVEQQDVISVEAFIGNTEFAVIANNGEVLASIQPPDKTARIRQAYQELLRLMRKKETIDVVLGLSPFSNMVITSFNIDRDAGNGADLPFSMEFKSIKIVKSEEAAVSASAPGAGAGDQAAGTSNQGTSSTTKPEINQSKEEWKRRVEMEGANKEILADYERRWGVPYPQ